MNCILLPASDITLPYAQINSPVQIEHINQVLKLPVGATLKIGQLGGNLGTAVIDAMSPSNIQLREVQLDIPPPAKLEVTLILALPRPKVLRRLIMDMTALGVCHIILINSYRTQKSYWQSPLLRRLDEFVLEGLQQGVDTIAPRISLQKRFKPFVEDQLPSLITHDAIVAHPYSDLSFSQYLQQSAQSISSARAQRPDVVCIGAEGGWVDYEIELLCKQGCKTVNIGPRILRTEAAVNVILGQWLI
ncbi:16S rRNA (uracil(1498)-N(3))-methyltransferase [Psychrobacter sp. FBL11]|uniref:Ribosomal RNA small subunit methyltransferase E n=1 Tax=Psychrobacter saeujeotis TaxID=3143436 RepID=A0ABU9X5F3_9GAMM|nr:16S rRNA (uracil(1498)-N(3))-methyltransferase [uncultured Psychrobacter sp.]